MKHGTIAPNSVGKYKTTLRQIDFDDGTSIPSGSKVKILQVSVFLSGYRLQLPDGATAWVAFNAVK